MYIYDIRKRRNLLPIALFLPVLTGWLLAGCMLGVPDEYREKELDRLVKESPAWREIYETCEQIPKPEDFKLVERRFGNAHYLVSFGFQSEMEPSEVFGFYDMKLKSNGWTHDGDGGGLNSKWKEYRKANVKITVSHGYFAKGANYGVECLNEE